ncbi:hypothetical protein MCEMSEM23_01872 [Rhabdaerophilaceae bacterium]
MDGGSRRWFLIKLSVACASLASAAAFFQRKAAGQPVAPVETSRIAGVAISGHDAVAYFTNSKPVMGRREFSLSHEGAEWWFATAENRARFQANPARYAPQFGGYCSWAVSQGYTASADPEAWAIRDGKLYLNYDKSIQERWATDIPGHIAKGNTHWPTLVGKK